jgi:cell division inhibitor SepF
MAGAFHRVMVYLGLVDDDYDDYDAYEDQPQVAPAPTPVPVRQPARSYPEAADSMMPTGGVRTLPRETEPGSNVSIQPRSAVVRPIVPNQSAKVHVVVPDGFNDAQEIGDHLKGGQPVIVNLQNCDRELSRRMMDFCSGAAYVLGAHPEKVADRVLLITPTNVEVSADEKRRLQERGLYRQ